MKLLNDNDILSFIDLVKKFTIENNFNKNILFNDPLISKYGPNCDYSKVKNFFFVLNINKNHWILFFCINFKYFIIDSLNLNHLLKSDFIFYLKKFNLNIVNSIKQVYLQQEQQTMSCGYYSLAFLTEIVFNIYNKNPKSYEYYSKIKFDESLFVSHYNKCLINNILEPFPKIN